MRRFWTLAVTAGIAAATLAVVPSPAHAGTICCTESPQIYVPANAASGTDGGLYVNWGDSLSFSVTGTGKYGYEGTAGCVGYPDTHPDGTRYVNGVLCSPAKKDDPNALLSGGAIGELLYRIGSGPWYYADPSNAVVAQTSGRLTLAYNDSYYPDNQGGYYVYTFDQAGIGSGGGGGGGTCTNVCTN